MRRAENMPKDNITRAIKRGTGESGENVEYTAVRYEGYGAERCGLCGRHVD